MKKILIIGQNPIKDDIKAQFLRLNYSLDVSNTYASVDATMVQQFDELVLLTAADDENAVNQDDMAVDWLCKMAEALEPIHLDNRPIVHLLLQSPMSLWMLQTMDLPAEVNEVFDVYPTTIEDVWAKNIFVQLPGIKNAKYPSLDWKPITKDSTHAVHVVISGFDKQAEAVAIHAALVAHFPNYHPSDELPLRTRITIIDSNIRERRDVFVTKYQHLFDNSYYRTVYVDSQTVDFHRPMYEGKRMDFVDVEWEFVDGTIHSPVVVEKIKQWAESDKHLLTFVVSHGNDECNMSEALAMPRQIYDKGIPVFVQQSSLGIYKSLNHFAQFDNVYPFGMKDCGYDVSMPLTKLAKLLKYFYDCSFGEEGVPTVLPWNRVEEGWKREKSCKMRFSNIYNVMTISTKMRSLGHSTEDSDTFYALSQKEIEDLSETEHNRWSVERLIQGARPCTDEETLVIRKDLKLKKVYKKKNVHFDLRSYYELEIDETGKNVKVYDYDLTACIPLIVKTFYEVNNHE